MGNCTYYVMTIIDSYDLNGDGGVSAQELYEVQSDLQTEGEV